ncbi:hypothetical protein [Duganella sp. S19_KUP01_CR8]|uniref:hypothetical protein n=1 Tax=Duganella sp. S19_KUP01_CR8 TaxID=3025502 RepID=UPI002FCD8168
MKTVRTWMSLAAVASVSLAASAQNGPPSGGQPPGPPPEAVAACKNKAEGTKVTFKGRRGEDVQGVCKKMRDIVVAVPEGGMPPPPEQGK